MTEAYTNLDNTTKFYNYGAQVPFNFNFIMQADKSSKPSKFKEIIDSWVQRVPPGNSSNWVVSITSQTWKIKFTIKKKTNKQIPTQI